MIIGDFEIYRQSDVRAVSANAAYFWSLHWGVSEYDTLRPCRYCGERAWIRNRDSGRYVCGGCRISVEDLRDLYKTLYEYPSYIETVLSQLGCFNCGGFGATKDALIRADELDTNLVGAVLSHLLRTQQIIREGNGDTARYWRMCEADDLGPLPTSYAMQEVA